MAWAWSWLRLAQKHMCRTFAGDILRALVAQNAHVDVSKEMLSRAEQDGPDGEMQLVDQPCAQVLANRGNAAAEADVTTSSCGLRLLQCGMNALDDEPKLRTSGHPERRARM